MPSSRPNVWEIARTVGSRVVAEGIESDDVLRFVAATLTGSVGPDDFVGHVGGDDFILVLRSDAWQSQCRGALDQFAREVRVFYDPGHREAGGITATDRRGSPCFYPFLSLSIGAVPVAPGLVHSHKAVAVAATEVKSQAKKMPGNSLFVDRRERGEAPATSSPPVSLRD